MHTCLHVHTHMYTIHANSIANGYLHLVNALVAMHVCMHMYTHYKHANFNWKWLSLLHGWWVGRFVVREISIDHKSKTRVQELFYF